MLNTIVLVNAPPEHKDTNHLGYIAYESLINDFKNQYHAQNRILILRYYFDKIRRERSLKLLRLVKDRQNNIIINEEKNFGNVKFTEINFLGLVFNYINFRFKADNTILITWGHGYGFGLFKQVSRFSNLKLTKNYDTPTYAYITSKINVISGQTDDSFSDISLQATAGGENNPGDELDDDKSDVLSTFELCQALKMGYQETSPNFKIDLLIFMNCDMMRFDTIYDLSYYVKYIIGPETPISWIGYNYAAIFAKLNSIINTNTQLNNENWEEVCKVAIESFKEGYDSFTEFVKKNFPDFPKPTGYNSQGIKTVISAIKAQSLKSIYDEFNSMLLQNYTNKYFNKICLIITRLLKDENLDTSNSWNEDANKPNLTTNSWCFKLKNFDLINILDFLKIRLPINSPVLYTVISLKQKISAAVLFIKPYECKSNEPKIDKIKAGFKGISINIMRSLEEIESDPYFKNFNIVTAKDRGKFARYSFLPEYLIFLYKKELFSKT